MLAPTVLLACRDGAILSEASEELAAIRMARSANKEAARTAVTAIARQLHSKGAAEGREPLLLRGRYCVAVRANQRSALSKGSVKLGASGTGRVNCQPAAAAAGAAADLGVAWQCAFVFPGTS